MAKRSTQRSGTSILEDAPLDLSDNTPVEPVAPDVEPPAPDYVPPPFTPTEPSAFDDLVNACQNATYSLLDVRNGQWQLLLESGANLRSFNSKDEGIEFVKELKITNCRCLSLVSPDNPLGIIQ